MPRSREQGDEDRRRIRTRGSAASPFPSRRVRTVLVVASFLLPACTKNFDDFDFTNKTVEGGTVVRGSGGTSPSSGGSTGQSGDASSTGGGSGGAIGPSKDGGGSHGGAAGGDASRSTGGGSATGGAAGTIPDGSTSDGAVRSDGSVCAAQEKQCGGVCVSDDATSTGCGAASCTPCAVPNATDTCVLGACAPATCNAGFGDCNDKPADGCETDVTSAVHDCGGCDNDCTLQRNGFACSNSLCGCHADPDCHTGGGAQGTVTCDTGAGLCHCDAATTCAHGEVCRTGACSCNAGKACTAGQTCCRAPAGCTDVTKDPASCGGCGHSCPARFDCNASVCECTDDPSCNAGSTGTCAAGVCTCGATACPKGERCLADGTCG